MSRFPQDVPESHGNEHEYEQEHEHKHEHEHEHEHEHGPHLSLHEKYNTYGEVIAVGDIEFTDKILGIGSYATVQLAKRQTKYDRMKVQCGVDPGTGNESRLRGSFNQDIFIKGYGDGELEESFVAVKTYSKSVLKRMRTLSTSRSPDTLNEEKDTDLHSSGHSVRRRLKIETAFEKVQQEIAIMKLMRHPNLVSLVEVIDSVESDALYLVLEYVPMGVIMEYDPISKRFRQNDERVKGLTKKGYFLPEYAALYFVDIMHGLAYLHEHKICHSDLKPENILIDERGVAKISDFGVSHLFEDERKKSKFKCAPIPTKLHGGGNNTHSISCNEDDDGDDDDNNVISNGRNGDSNDENGDENFNHSSSSLGSLFSIENVTITPVVERIPQKLTLLHHENALNLSRLSSSGSLTIREGTYSFWSPEMCNGESVAYSGYASDMWAAGVCLYIFASGKLPFNSDDPNVLFSQIINNNPPLISQHKHKFSHPLKDLLSMLLQKNPDQRASIGDSLQHQFLKKARDQRIFSIGEEIRRSSRQELHVSPEQLANAFMIASSNNVRKLAKCAHKRLNTAVGALSKSVSGSFTTSSMNSSSSSQSSLRKPNHGSVSLSSSRRHLMLIEEISTRLETSKVEMDEQDFVDIERSREDPNGEKHKKKRKERKNCLPCCIQ